jgi:hypothetical protein
MYLLLLTVLLVSGFVSAALAQPASRFEVGPVLRLDKVFIQGGASGGTVVAGVVTSFRISKSYAMEAELTQARNGVERSYQGWFFSYAQGPNLTREEIERLAPIVRRSLGYEPRFGWSAAFVARGEASPRVNVAARVGFAARKYVETSTFTVLSVPEGIDPERVARDFRDSSTSRTRAGLLLGFDVTVAVTDHLSVAPEIRFVHGGPARIGNKHREAGLGARAVWRF